MNKIKRPLKKIIDTLCGFLSILSKKNPQSLAKKNTALVIFLKLLVIFSLIIFSISIFAQYRHPVGNIRMTSLFGESREDHFHTGIDYATRQPVLAIEEGFVVFSRDTSKNPKLLELGTGNAIVLQHPDNLRSYYLHLENNSITEKERVENGEEIAIMGNTGSSYGHHLHIDIEEPKENRILNPLAVLPNMPDDNPPYIISMFAQINEKLYRIRKQSKFRYSGPMELVVISWDGRMNQKYQRNPLNALRANPYRIELWVDDELFKVLDFKHLHYQDNDIVLASGQRFDEVYGYDFNYRMATFSPSKNLHRFRVVSIDKNNNYSEASYTISFN